MRERKSRTTALLARYAEVGLSLSGEDDLEKLLEMIVDVAREVSGADAGTLYMIDETGEKLDFVVLQNDALKVRLGGPGEEKPALPPVPLYVKGTENHANVSSHVALTGDIIGIPDVYESEDFDFTGPRKYDEATGYRSKSMLVIPMRNHERDIIGVLQLLNAKDPDGGDIVEFDDDAAGLVVSLASQAAAGLTKTRLITSLTELFHGFIKSIARAIDEKSRYTGGHISRVASLTMRLAEEIDRAKSGPFKDVHLNGDEMEELFIASWLHDVGKIAVPDWVVDKRFKLETIFDRMELVEERFQVAELHARLACEQDKAGLLAQGREGEIPDLEAALQLLLAERRVDLELIAKANVGAEFLNPDIEVRLRAVAAKTFDRDGHPAPLLTEDELENLLIKRGTLNDAERKIIKNHAALTHKILKELPFPKKMAKAPDYAAAHHERLDGSGYPFGLTADQLAVQARAMAVADIFEALTAKDRPYKKPMKLKQAVDILGSMSKAGHIDPDIYELFTQSCLLSEYAQEHLDPGQVDLDLPPPCLREDEDKTTLAVHRLMASAPAAPAAAEEGKCRTTVSRVLLIEDAINTRMLIRYFLRNEPFETHYAENGLKGLELFISCKYDLVLTELDMPLLDGRKTVAAMRSFERAYGLKPKPIIALVDAFAGGATAVDPALLRKEGFSDVLVKPIDHAELRRMIAKRLV